MNVNFTAKSYRDFQGHLEITPVYNLLLKANVGKWD